MPKAVEDCVKKISGNNKKTGKPYTQSEKWAICQAANKKSKAGLDEPISDEDIALAEEHMGKEMDACHQRMMKSGRAKTDAEAHQLCMKELAKSGFDIYKLQMFLDIDLLKNV